MRAEQRNNLLGWDLESKQLKAATKVQESWVREGNTQILNLSRHKLRNIQRMWEKGAWLLQSFQVTSLSWTSIAKQYSIPDFLLFEPWHWGLKKKEKEERKNKKQTVVAMQLK